jgi:23S rRNA-/tRNA-specific pseudouridylate synthase
LAGDATYGYNPNKYGNRLFPRVMLHARQLSFRHPETEDELSFTAPMPDDFKAALSSLSPL